VRVAAGREHADETLVDARELLGADARPLAGGYSGETFLVGAAGEQAVLRLYVRDPTRAEIDAALLRLVRGLVPVPRVLDMRTQAQASDTPAYLLLERLPGVRLDLWLADADPDRRRRAGVEVGRVLARLAGVPFRRPGRFVDGQLRIEPWPPGFADLESCVDAHRQRGGLAVWSDDEIMRLREVARTAQDLLDSAGAQGLAPPRLVHSDFNPKNLLVEPGSGTITGVVDWEFAHSGSSYEDLGNLLRFETDEPFASAVVRTFADLAPSVSPRFVELGRAVDLFALIELAARTDENPVVDRARQLLREIVRTGDLSAGRPAWA